MPINHPHPAYGHLLPGGEKGWGLRMLWISFP